MDYTTLRKTNEGFALATIIPRQQRSTLPETNTQSMFEFSKRLHESGDYFSDDDVFLDIILREGLQLAEDDEYVKSASEPFGQFAVYNQPTDPTIIQKQMESNPKKYVDGVIRVESGNLAVCEPFDKSDDIMIHGRSQAGQTFTDDEVRVEITSERSKGTKKSRSTSRCGRVVQILRRTRKKDIKYPVFLCSLGHLSSYMTPICQTIPKIYIMSLSRKKHDGSIEIIPYDRTGQRLQNPTEKISSRDEKSHNLFTVVVLGWHPSRTYPVGVVISKHAYSLETNDDDYLKMLDRIHGIPSFYSKATVIQTEKLVKELKGKEVSEKESNYLNVFTIDDELSKCLDDAFSVECIDRNKWRIGVHITDVTSFIEKDSPIDTEAQTLRETQYQGGSTWKYPVHMIPEPLSNDRLSLLPDRSRQVLSIYFEVEKKQNEFRLCVKQDCIRVSKVVSKRKFSYEEVDRILSEEIQADTYRSNLQLLNHVAMGLKSKRLGNAAEYAIFCEDGEDEGSEYFRSHDLVQEFMIYTNYHIAKFLLQTFKDRIPLRCQEAPSTEKLKQWRKDFKYVKDVVVALQNQTTSSEDISPYEGGGDRKCIGVLHSTNEIPSEELVRIRRDQWKKLDVAANASHTDDSSSGNSYLDSLLKDDARYPYQYHAFQEWRHFQHTARHVCSKHIDLESSEARHFSLAIYPYLHFTSPLRRYIDNVNHRLVHAALEGKPPPYTTEEISKFCELANSKRRILTRYRESIDSFIVIQNRRFVPQMYEAYIINFTPNSMQLSIPDFYGKRIGRSDLTVEIPFRFLQLKSAPNITGTRSGNINRNEMSCSLHWEKKVFAAPGGHLDAGDPLIKSSRFIPLTIWREVIRNYLAKRLDKIREIIQEWVDVFQHCDVGDDSLLFQKVPRNKLVRQYLIPNNKQGEKNDHRTKQSVRLHLDQVVGVQIESKLEKGLEAPLPQYVTFSDSLTFCIKHCLDPISYFCGYGSIQTKLYYRSLHQYTSTWLPIIEMESVYGAVKEGGPVTVKGIKYTVNGTNSGEFSLQTEFCLCRGIDLSKANMNMLPKESNPYNQKQEAQNTETASSNYLCLRCDMATHSFETSAMTTQWIAHAKITHIHVVPNDGISQPEHYEVSFKLIGATANVFDGERKGTIEMIQKSIVERRQETIFRKHFEDASDLAESIALGTGAPPLFKKYVSKAKKMDKDVPKTFHSMPRNNEGQRNAIAKSLISSFSLIQGPPGTGKTVTGIKLLYLLNKLNTAVFEEKRQIVFCGPSNKSVDHVARWLMERLKPNLENNTLNVVRVYGKAFVYKEFPVPTQFNFLTEGKALKKTDQALVEYGVVLHHIIRQMDKPHSEKLREFDKQFKETPDEVTLAEFMEYQKIHSEAEQAEMKNYDVIFCTVSMTGNPKLLKATQGKIQQCIIDECGMCNEPETMVPIIALRPEQVILIGDHKQLQPIIKCRDAARLGLSRSLFERYHSDRLQATRTMLKLQYRMHPMVCKFPSDTFYDGKLKTDEDNTVSWWMEKPLSIWKNSHSPKQHIPLAMFHVEGEEDSMIVSTDKGNEQSKSNQQEAKMVIKVLQYFIREKVDVGDVNVMSQYNAQCSLLKDKLREQGIQTTNVNTVVSSQGGEWDYVIFSTTRSLPEYLIEKRPTLDWRFQHLGFIVDKHQINVALTRARKGIVIIGNTHLLEVDPVWGQLVSFYREKDCVHYSDSVLRT